MARDSIMAKRYSSAELLLLRDSPLVCKPASLPSAEEWMGPPPEQNQRKPAMNRAKTEETFSPSDIPGPRTTLYETRHMSRGSSTLPSEIILGPPKTSFASASSARNTSKTFDSPNRTAFNTHNGDNSRSDQYGAKEKSQKERERLDGDDYKARELRPGLQFGRRTGKEDGESWSGLRSGKHPSTDDTDRQFRRGGERDFRLDKGENGDAKRPQRGFENHRRDLQRESDDQVTPRRNGMGRGSRPSWYKDDDALDSELPEINRDSTKTRDWRDGDRVNRRGPERDWDRNRKAEQDPEWMLEPDTEEKKQTHTAADIEQWKASMRAAKGSADPAASSAVGVRPVAQPLTAPKLDTPLGLDPTFDKFFGLWNEPKPSDGATADAGVEQQPKSDVGKLNASRSSRFTGFFSPKPEIQSQGVGPPPPAATELTDVDSSIEDKAGFQRIMQMLGGGNMMPSAPQQAADGLQSNNQLFGDQLSKTLHEQQAQQSTRKVRTPHNEQATTHSRTSPPIISPRSRRSITLDNLLSGPQSPREAAPIHTQISESEFLLSLMKQKGTETRSVGHGNQRSQASNAPGILPHPNLINITMGHPPQQSQDQTPNPNFFDEIRAENADSQDKLNPTFPIRRAHRGSVPGLFDDFCDGLPQRQQQMGIAASYGVLPGLQRPPGFEQLPPGYSQHLQQQRHNPVNPPPGFQNPNRNPNQFPPGLVSNFPNLNIGPERVGPPQYMRQMNIGPGAPPQVPPPGFMGMGGPPPGFPPLHDEAGRIMFGGMPQRGPMDMFGDGGGFGMGNGNGNVGPGRGGFGGQFVPAGFKRHE